jgi:hypothetical protein
VSDATAGSASEASPGLGWVVCANSACDENGLLWVSGECAGIREDGAVVGEVESEPVRVSTAAWLMRLVRSLGAPDGSGRESARRPTRWRRASDSQRYRR